MVIESQKMLLKYVSSLAPHHFFVGPDVAPHFLHAGNATVCRLLEDRGQITDQISLFSNVHIQTQTGQFSVDDEMN